MSKRALSASPQASNKMPRVDTPASVGDNAQDLNHAATLPGLPARLSLMGMPREIRNLIYEKVLEQSIPTDLRIDNLHVGEEFDLVRYDLATGRDAVVEVAMQPAYHTCSAISAVNHQLAAEFLEAKMPRPNLFVNAELQAKPFGSHGCADHVAKRTRELTDWVRVTLFNIQKRLPLGIKPRTACFRFYYSWVYGESSGEGDLSDFDLLVDDMVQIEWGLQDVEEINLELVIPDKCADTWGGLVSPPCLDSFLSSEPLGWSDQDRFSPGPMEFRGNVEVFRKTVMTSGNVVLLRIEENFNGECFEFNHYTHPDFGREGPVNYGELYPPAHVREKLSSESSEGDDSHYDVSDGNDDPDTESSDTEGSDTEGSDTEDSDTEDNEDVQDDEDTQDDE